MRNQGKSFVCDSEYLAKISNPVLTQTTIPYTIAFAKYCYSFCIVLKYNKMYHLDLQCVLDYS